MSRSVFERMSGWVANTFRRPRSVSRQDLLDSFVATLGSRDIHASYDAAKDTYMRHGGDPKALDLILVPRVNPDGAEMGTRRNANKMDLNRNHVILSEPESSALHQLFLEWKPEVTLDIHEYNAVSKTWISHGMMKDAEEMLGAVSNLNISEKIR